MKEKMSLKEWRAFYATPEGKAYLAQKDREWNDLLHVPTKAEKIAETKAMIAKLEEQLRQLEK